MDEFEGIEFQITGDNTSAISSLDAVLSKLKELKGLVSDGGLSKGLDAIGKSLKAVSSAGSIGKITKLTKAISEGSSQSPLADGLSMVSEAARDATADLEAFDRAKEKAWNALAGGRIRFGSVSDTAKRMAASRYIPKLNEQEFFRQYRYMGPSPASMVPWRNGAYSVPPGGGSGGGGGSPPGGPRMLSWSGGNRNLPIPSNRFKEYDPNVFDAEWSEVSKKGFGLSDVISRVKEFGKTLIDAASNSKVLGVGLALLKPALTALGKLVRNTGKNFASFLGKAAVTGLKSGFDYLTGGIRDVVGGLGRLISQIKRVAMYRILRSLIREIGAGLTEGIGNLYQWSLAVDRTFSSAMDRISTASQYIKNSFAAMASPLIESLAPAIDFIADKIVSLFNLFNQLFALLTGKGYWTKAVKTTAEYAKAANSGAGATKSLKQQIDLVLASFDELHLLAKPTGSSGGGGGGAGAASVDYGAMFENVAFDQALKDLIDRQDWSGVGGYFADKLNAVTLAADDWLLNKFNPWLARVGTAAGEFINGFVYKYQWDLLGKTMADGLNGIVRALNNFYETTDWAQIGTAIGTTVRSWFTNVDWDQITKYFSNKLNALIKTAKGFVTSAMGDGGKFGKTVAGYVADWFDQVDWNSLGETLRIGINGSISAVLSFLKSDRLRASIRSASSALWKNFNEIDWNGLGKAVWKSIKTLIDNIDWFGIGEAIGGFLAGINWVEVIGKATEVIAKLVFGFLSGLWDGILGWWDDLRVQLHMKYMGVDEDTARAMLGLNKTFDSGLSTINATTSSGYNTISSTTSNALRGLTTSAGSKAKEASDAVNNGYSKALGTNTGDINSGVNKLKDNTSTAIRNADFKSTGSSIAGDITSGIKGGLSGANYDTQISKMKGKITGKFENMLSGVNLGKLKVTVPVLKAKASDNKLEWNRISYSEYAKGGMPDYGELYMAREAGPELVGTVGGRNAVMNNDQIVQAVSTGVARAVASVMANRGGTTVVLEGDARGLFRAFVRENNETVAQTGSSPLLI